MVQRIKHLPAMRETRVQSLGWEDPLEKEMATHSNILAWRIPWIGEPGRLQSTGLQRVRHNWATSLYFTSHPLKRLPRCYSGKEPTCQCRRHRRHGFDSWVRKTRWNRKWQSTLVFLPGRSHGQRSLGSYGPWGRKEWTGLNDLAWTCAHFLLKDFCLQFVEPYMKVIGARPRTNTDAEPHTKVISGTDWIPTATAAMSSPI